MKKLILVLSMALFIGGCGTISGSTQIVKIPAVTKCEPSVTPRDPVSLPFDNATKEMSLYDKFKLLLAENNIISGHNKELKAALRECTK
jgi:hypothetical protein